MTITDELAYEARALKLAMCRREPMADIPDPVLYVVGHTGKWYTRNVRIPAGIKTGTVTRSLRMFLPEQSFASAAMVADSHYKLFPAGEVKPVGWPRHGDLEAEYGDDPRSTVARAVVVYVVTCTGHRDVTLLPYVWSDTGQPVWGDALRVGPEIVGGPYVAVADSMVGVQ